MLQFEDLTVNNFNLFYYVHIFVKNCELVSNAFFSMNVENKNRNILRKKSHSVFEGLKLGPFEHTKTVFRKMF